MMRIFMKKKKTSYVKKLNNVINKKVTWKFIKSVKCYSILILLVVEHPKKQSTKK